ncbi:MAG: hypothetical protein LIO93_07320 [Bacteroidales bacterium]|nr:hypothetical protein [Bacteroidales bacterium]
MKKNVIFIGLTFLFSITNIFSQVIGDFPYFESFLNSEKPQGIETPTPTNGKENSIQFLDSGVQLTPNAKDKFGAFYLNNHEFPSSAGIFISFEYMIYDGDGGDGFSVFFFDANEQNPGIGAPGAGIGYAYNRSVNNATHSRYRSQGLKSAFLGIAFDSYGNFKKMRYQGESRVNGIPFNFATTGSSETLDERGVSLDGNNEVTLRGPMNPSPILDRNSNPIPGLGIGYGGYPVLVTQRTTANVGFRLKTVSNYAWEKHNQLKAKNFFTIRGGKSFERPSDEGYRKAFIEMFPRQEGGFYVSVMIENELSRDTVIYDYEFRTNFNYLENALTNSQGDNYTGDDPILNSTVRNITMTVPFAMKIGFAAATGVDTQYATGKTDKHVIKNLSVKLPRSAEAYDDYAEDKYQGVDTVLFLPLANDIGYKGSIARVQDPCPECIDSSTFRFIQPDGTVSPNPFECIIPKEGKWTFDSDKGIAKFEPLPSFHGNARINYDVKGGKIDPDPYAQEAYRSGQATIGVNIVPVKSIISNKMITGKIYNEDNKQ